jgi:nitrous oxide reductase accessory protein NosL
MKRLALTIILSALAFLTAACTPAPEAEKQPAPSIFVISIMKRMDYDGRDMYLFEYAIDGAVHQAVFRNAEDCRRFVKYLETVGDIQEAEYE